jgi:subtilase family serine protease
LRHKITLICPAEAVDVEHKSVVTNETNNENQIWLISYGKELQGLVITDREIESHYYDIHTAVVDAFLV